MPFKEEPEKRKFILTVHFFWEKKLYYLLNCVEIHVIYVEKVLTKMDIWGCGMRIYIKILLWYLRLINDTGVNLVSHKLNYVFLKISSRLGYHKGKTDR